MKDKKKVGLTVVSLILLLIIVIGASYAAFSYSKKGSVLNTITTGSITMTYNEAENGINLSEAMPISDIEGKNLVAEGQVFEFTVGTNISGNKIIAYEVTAEKDNTSTLADSDVRIYLEKSTDRTTYESVYEPTGYIPLETYDTIGAKQGEMVLETSTLSNDTTYYYKLKMWIAESYKLDEENKSFKIKINVYGGDYAPKITSTSDCWKNKTIDSCAAGTPITYEVSNGATQDFYVLKDNGSTLTLITTNNIVNSTVWNETGNNADGPITANAALINATSGWNTIARMITLEEAYSVGCEFKSSTCQIWLSSNHWTSFGSDPSSGSTDSATLIGSTNRNLLATNVSAELGVRAVITISK